MSSIFQAFNGFIDKGVDLFFKKVLMVEEIPVLCRYDENYFHNNNNNQNNNSNMYNSNNMYSENSIADPNFTRADGDVFNSHNHSVFNSDYYSSNENTDRNVFAKLTSGKTDKGKNRNKKNNTNNNPKEIKEFDINNINYRNKLNKNDENQGDNVFSNITGKAGKGRDGNDYNNLNNSYSYENNNYLHNDTDNNRLLKDHNSKSEKELNSLNQLNIFNKINIKNENEIDSGLYFNNNFGNNVSENIAATDLFSRRSKRTAEKPVFGNYANTNSIHSSSKNIGVFRNNLYGQNTNRTKLRGNQQKLNSHGFDSNNFNDEEIFEIDVSIVDDNDNFLTNNNETEVKKDSKTNNNDAGGKKNEEVNLNKKKKASNFKKISKDNVRK